jgi:N-acetylmuramoyl-L-alanine amidase
MFKKLFRKWFVRTEIKEVIKEVEVIKTVVESGFFKKINNPEYLVFIDAGHGWFTRGKQSDLKDVKGNTMMKENYFNSAVAQKLSMLLNFYGIENVIINNTWLDTALQTRTDFVNKTIDKISAVNSNASIPTDLKPIFISIHADASSTSPEASGFGVFRYKKTKVSIDLSLDMNQALTKNLKSFVKPRSIKEKDFHVLRETNCPAVLVECGFMTNEDDVLMLRSQIYQTKVAEALLEGILYYYGE